MLAIFREKGIIMYAVECSVNGANKNHELNATGFSPKNGRDLLGSLSMDISYQSHDISGEWAKINLINRNRAVSSE